MGIGTMSVLYTVTCAWYMGAWYMGARSNSLLAASVRNCEGLGQPGPSIPGEDGAHRKKAERYI